MEFSRTDPVHLITDHALEIKRHNLFWKTDECQDKNDKDTTIWIADMWRNKKGHPLHSYWKQS